MQRVNLPINLAHPFCTVKPSINSQLSFFSDSVIHHNVSGSRKLKERIVYSGRMERRYGVSLSRRVLSPGLLLKKFDLVRDFLQYVLHLTTAQREVILRLLRLWAYYGNVYPKEATITAEPGCSKATYWRTVHLLEQLGLIQVINRFILRPHAQISNLYRLARLIVVLAKYLAEHIAHVWPDWLDRYISTPWPELWSLLAQEETKLEYQAAGARTAHG